MFNIQAFLLNSSIGSHLIPLFLFFLLIKRNRAKDVRVIFWYCAYTFINDLLVINAFNLQTKGNTTFILLSVFTIVEYLLFAFVIYLNLKTLVFKRIIIIVSPLFLLLCIYLLLNPGNKADIDSVSITVEYILIIAFSLFFFFEELNEPNTTFIYASYTFWLIVGILIYSTGTFFFFMQSSDLTNEQWQKWAVINYVFTIIKNAFFSVAMIINKSGPPPEGNSRIKSRDRFEKPITPF